MSHLDADTFGGTFPWRSKFIDAGGARLAYVDEGDKAHEPIVMLHGNPTWSYLYRKFIPVLARTNRAIAVDHLGFGRSDKPLEGDYTLAGHIRNFTALMDTLDLRDVTLVMQDWGGPIGLGWATTHADRVKRLVIMNTWAFRVPAGTQLYPLLELFRQPVVGQAMVQGLNLFVEGFLPSAIARKELLNEIMPAYRAPFPDWNSRIAVARFPHDIPVGDDHPSMPEMGRIQDNLGKLNVPTLLIWGMQDPAIGPALLEVWKSIYPHAEVHTIAGASHFLQEDAPEEVVAYITDFVARTR